MLKLNLSLAVVACVLSPSIAFSQAAPASATSNPSASAPKLVPRAPGDVAPPEHPATPDQIRDYLELTKASENAHHAFSQLIANSKSQAPPSFPADFWDDLTKSFNGIDVVAELTPLYQRYFSQEDMAAALVFYKTPAGKRVLADQPLAAVSAGDVLRRDGQRVGQETYARHKAEIDASQKTGQPSLSSPSSTPSSSTPAKPTLSSPPDNPAGSQPQPQPQPQPHP